MTANRRCPECGKPLPHARVPGKCPACLLRAGLDAGAAAGPLDGSLPLDRQVTFSLESAHVGKVLETLAHSIGSIPRVLLPDTEANHDATAVVKPLSSEMPSPAERGDRYQLFGEIARGGMGAILKGRDADLGRDLAFKVLLESHQGKPDLLRRFVEEAQIGGQLQHPGIVPVYELGTFNDQRPYFTMKLVKGRTLASLLHARKTPDDDLPRFLGIFEQVCQTVAYAHAHAVIHRDLKPTNVMVGSFGEVQVMDWGLAKVLREGSAAEDGRTEPAPVQVSVIQTVRSGSTVNDSQAGSVLGTPAYMSPEQAGGDIEQVDRRADVFGLGSILCEILTGQPAYTGRVSGEVMRKAARGNTTDALARLHASGADGALVSLARSCLAVEAIDRPRDARQVAESITAYQNSVVERLRRAEVERAAEQVRAVEERRRHRMSLALAASVLALVLLGGGGAFWLVQDRRARQAKLDLALQGAELLQNQALGTREGAVEKWQAALLAVEKAAGVLGTMPTDEARARLSVLEESVRRGIAQATADEQLVTRLDQIRATVDGKQADDAYAEAFRAASLDIHAPQAMRERLAARPAAVREAVVTALDAWSVVRSDEAGSKRVLNAARAIDSDDPWHNQLRDALERKDLQGFRRLAQRAPELAKQGPVSLWLLGHSLEVLGDHDL
ncbi:MAG TPA: protein kinase, partial [Isosphaeraceae bacterium]|nr:protein kinase [Isosphaeraceae bacterium]